MPAANGEELRARAKTANEARYRFAEEHGTFHVTEDGRSFYVLRRVDHADTAAPRRVLVTLHGHGSWATDEFALWEQASEKHGVDLLALQWWFGGGEATSDYYTSRQMHALLDGILRREGYGPRSVMLHGFSRGATNVYGLVYLDGADSSCFIDFAFANSGGTAADYPINREIADHASARPFAGTRWGFYCGDRDPNPDRDGCPAMTRARAWVESLGGTTELFLEDTSASHGGFHHNADFVDRTLEIFTKCPSLE